MIIHPADNVEVRADGHKYARCAIPCGAPIIKYGMPIGHATVPIACGEHVHSHNLASDLGEQLEYHFTGAYSEEKIQATAQHIMAYRRADGQIGIRNDIWIIPTVGCVNTLCERLAASCNGIALSHPYGCSQLGGDHEMTANLLAALCRHPNAGGVLVVALGCENNTIESFMLRLGDTSKLNIRFLRAQDEGDEFERGCKLIAELEAARVTTRSEVSCAELTIGLKCGGSDGFSGLTANPLVGRFTDWIVAHGGAAVLSEVPEMFGAETLLMQRAASREVFEKCAKMINNFKAYYTRHGQPCGENPSPGNKQGGITTLEEKSLGCVQKAGSATVRNILNYGARVTTRGLTLLSAPGNDLVSSTALAAAGCHLILFTTGRGTPFGTVVPTMKIATNSTLATAKPHWIDWDAMAQNDVAQFAARILAIANGERVRNEINHAQQIAIFKDGVTL